MSVPKHSPFPLQCSWAWHQSRLRCLSATTFPRTNERSIADEWDSVCQDQMPVFRTMENINIINMIYNTSYCTVTQCLKFVYLTQKCSCIVFVCYNDVDPFIRNLYKNNVMNWVWVLFTHAKILSRTVKGSTERSDNPMLEEKVYSAYTIFCPSSKSFNCFVICINNKRPAINNSTMAKMC